MLIDSPAAVTTSAKERADGVAPDPLLQRLVRIVEEQQVYLPITLYVSGRPVSGLLTSAADFRDRAKAELQEIVGEDAAPAVRETLGLLEEAFETAYEADASRESTHEYLYLTDVCLLGSRTLDLSNTTPSPCLRFRLTAVEAFHLMSLTTDVPLEADELV